MQLVTQTQPSQTGDFGRRALVLPGSQGWEWVLNYPWGRPQVTPESRSPERPEIMALMLSSRVKPQRCCGKEGKQNLHLLRFLCWWSFSSPQLSVVLQQSDPPKVGSQDSRDLGEQVSFSTSQHATWLNLSSELLYLESKPQGMDTDVSKPFHTSLLYFFEFIHLIWQPPACLWWWSSRF